MQSRAYREQPSAWTQTKTRASSCASMTAPSTTERRRRRVPPPARRAGWYDVATRMLKQFTAIGAILDPVADKLLGLSAVVLLCLTHRLPRWLLWMLVFRELCIVGAIAILTRAGRSYAIRPTRFGKYATAFL